MARAATLVETTPEVDAIEGVPLPREQVGLLGQAEAEATLLDAYRSGRIHHGWLFGGPKGIGKATLAFRFARFVLAHPDPRLPAVARATDLSVDPEHPAFRKVASGAHTELLHIRRPWDEKGKRFKQDVTVEEVRRTVGFFGQTAGEGGWRIAIVDPADDMNASAANALLKILEEPPARSLILVLSHQPGRLLPTIRSRCRRLALEALDEPTLVAGLEGLGFAAKTDHSTLYAAARIADGSLRRAILMIENDGVAIHRRVETIANRLPALDVKAMHQLADIVTARGADDVFEVAVEFLQGHAAEAARRAAEAGDGARAAAYAEAFATIGATVGTNEALNLDRRATVVSLLRTLVEAARN